MYPDLFSEVRREPFIYCLSVRAEPEPPEVEGQFDFTLGQSASFEVVMGLALLKTLPQTSIGVLDWFEESRSLYFTKAPYSASPSCNRRRKPKLLTVHQAILRHTQ